MEIPAHRHRLPASPVRLPGLDGVRAVAVLGVMLYHLDLGWMPGGFLGVDVFFVLSGFLITSLLIRDIETTGHFAWTTFYVHRARRLLPPLFAMLACVCLTALFVVRDAAPRLKTDTLAALAYASNWWSIVNEESYFESTGRAPLLQHLWSLAIEEQFYLAWPVVLFCVGWFLRRRAFAVACLFGAAISTGWMTYLSMARQLPQAGDPSRVYFGTDSHSMGLLVGAALAAHWSPWTREPAPYHWLTPRRTWMAGATSLVILLCAFVFVGEFSPLLYRGGFLIISCVAGVLILAASRTTTRFGALLGVQPLRWIGERSYGLYLWHWPIFMISRPILDLPDLGHLGSILRLAVTAVITELSYTLIEHPIRSGGLSRFVDRWRMTAGPVRRRLEYQALAVLTVIVIVVGTAVTGLWRTPPAAPLVAQDVAEAMGIQNGGPTSVAITRAASGSIAIESVAPAVEPTIASAGSSAASVIGDIELPAPVVVMEGDNSLTAVGDSVLLGARFALERSIAGARTDAEVGRQAAGVLTRLDNLRKDGLLAPRVLVHLGTNGLVTEQQLRRTLAILRDRDAVIVANAHAPRRWVETNNELIKRVTAEYPNSVIADWAQVSMEHPEFFASDGVHLTRSGQDAFVSEVIRVGHFSPAPPVKVTRPKTPNRTIPSQSSTSVPSARGAPDGATAPSVPAAPPARIGASTTSLGALIRYKKPFAHDSFWDDIARCESRNNWIDGGQFSGGLGIYVGSWRGWGGLEFASTPDAATREQQIIVANRISTQGWRRPDGSFIAPVGFSGWGCGKLIDAPHLVRYDPDSVLLQRFTWQQSDVTVSELQLFLRLPTSGTYNQETWQRHLQVLASRRLPRHLAP